MSCRKTVSKSAHARDHLLLPHAERLRVHGLKPLHAVGCLSLKHRSLFLRLFEAQLQLLQTLSRVAKGSLKSFDLHKLLRITRDHIWIG